MAQVFNSVSYSNQQQIVRYFEYFLLKTLQWLKTDGDLTKNDLSVLKCQKLLFFTVAINCRSHSNNAVLAKDVFNNFKAYQYGPVEENIYNLLKQDNNELSHLKLTFKGLDLKINTANLDELIREIEISDVASENYFSIIRSSISDLRNRNKNLINYTPFNLVELSHRWRCWSHSYSEGNRTAITWKSISEESMNFSL